MPLEFAGGQFALLLGYWFVAWVAAMWACRPWKSSTSHSALGTQHSALRYLWWLSAPTFGVFLLALAFALVAYVALV